MFFSLEIKTCFWKHISLTLDPSLNTEIFSAVHCYYRHCSSACRRLLSSVFVVHPPSSVSLSRCPSVLCSSSVFWSSSSARSTTSPAEDHSRDFITCCTCEPCNASARSTTSPAECWGPFAWLHHLLYLRAVQRAVACYSEEDDSISIIFGSVPKFDLFI